MMDNGKPTPWTRACSCGEPYVPKTPGDGICPRCTARRTAENVADQQASLCCDSCGAQGKQLIEIADEENDLTDLAEMLVCEACEGLMAEGHQPHERHQPMNKKIATIRPDKQILYALRLAEGALPDGSIALVEVQKALLIELAKEPPNRSVARRLDIQHDQLSDYERDKIGREDNEGTLRLRD